MDRQPSHDLPIRTIPLPTPFPVGPVNVYLVQTDALVLFDTGPKSEDVYRELMAGLKNAGVSVRDLQAIVTTHGHIDHIGLLNRLAEESGAATYGHPFVVSQWTYSEEKALQRRTYFAELFAQFGVPEESAVQCIDHWNSFRYYTDDVRLDHAIDQDARLFGFTVHHLPGHSPSDLVFAHDKLGFAITGDHLLPDMSPNPLMRKPVPGHARAKSLVEYRESLRRCRTLDLGLCFPGHGPQFDEHRKIIDNLMRRHDRRTEQVAALVRERPMNPYQVCLVLFPKLGTSYLYLGISAAVGHLEILEEEGRVRSSVRDGNLVYDVAL